MGGDKGGTKVSCPAGKWTNVIWWAGLVGRTYRVDIGRGNSAKWRRYGAGIPPYWVGSFTGTETFTWYPWDPYIRVDIEPSKDVTAVITKD